MIISLGVRFFHRANITPLVQLQSFCRIFSSAGFAGSKVEENGSSDRFLRFPPTQIHFIPAGVGYCSRAPVSGLVEIYDYARPNKRINFFGRSLAAFAAKSVSRTQHAHTSLPLCRRRTKKNCSRGRSFFISRRRAATLSEAGRRRLKMD